MSNNSLICKLELRKLNKLNALSYRIYILWFGNYNGQWDMRNIV